MKDLAKVLALNSAKKKYWHFRQNLNRLPALLFKLNINLKYVLKDYSEQTWVIIELFKHSLLRQKHFNSLNTNKNRNILIISYYASPYRSSLGTQRTMKYIKYLSHMGWHITLLTSELPENEPTDEYSEQFPANVKVVRIPSTRLYSNLNKIGVFVPDDFIHWVRPSLAAFERLNKEDNYSIIYSTVPPYTNAIIGTIASAKTGIPHIPDFRDPWTKIDIGWRIKNRFLDWLNKKLEYQVLKQSKHIVMADDLEYQHDYFVDTAQILNNPISSITNGYDEEDFQNINPITDTDKNKFNISYIGGIYDQETFKNIIDPILIWANKYPKDMNEVSLTYAGSSFSFFTRLDRPPFSIYNAGFLTHNAAISLRFNSNVQLFSQPLYFKPHVYSGKIFEMIRTPVPILAIVKKDSAVTRLITRTKTGFSVPQEQKEKAAEILKQLFEDWKMGNFTYAPDMTEVEKYSRIALANKLNNVFSSILL